MPDYQHKRPLAVAAFSAAMLASGLVATSTARAGQVSSAAVATDGAVTTNASWEAHTSSTWYIELQRVGTDYIEAGISNENPSQIAQGLKILDWGWAHQGSDGSFPGTGSGTGKVGGMFHTTSLFFEAATRAVLDLQKYNPVTYDMPAGFYASKIAQYTTDIALTGQWLTTPSVLAAGQSFNQPYTHRRYILAAGLQEAAVVTNNPQLTVVANSFIADGLSRQLPLGWTASLTQASDGSIPPAILVAPNTAQPDGTLQVVDATGVNPERNGYDVSYQMVGCLFACRWYANATDPTYKPAVKAMLTAGLRWERQQVGVDGTVNTNGCSRIGVDATQDGEGIKTLATAEVIGAFQQGAHIDQQPLDYLAAIRVADSNITVNSDTILPSGAVVASKYNIGNQADAYDFIRNGIHRENEAMIQQGLAMLDWGWSQQASDGSFPGTPSPYTDIATFIQAATRAVLDLRAYSQPISHSLPFGGYRMRVSGYIAKIATAATYLQNPTLLHNYASFWSASRLFLYADAMQNASIITGNSSFAQTGQMFLNAALAMQLPDGTNPENGVFSANAQASGVGYAMDFYSGVTDTGTQTAVVAFIAKSLIREGNVIDANGTITASSPAHVAINRAFAGAAQLTGDPIFGIVANRINVIGL